MLDSTAGVKLAPLNRENCEHYRMNRNMLSIRKWCRQTGIISEEAQKRWYDAQDKDPAINMFEIIDGISFVGVCGLTSIDLLHRRAEFSLWISGGQQGKGFGRLALHNLFCYGFRELGLNTIWGETFEGNPAAKMFEGLGMVNEGKRRDFYFKDGKFIDATLYSIKASEWT